jgi:hypothetical protein
MPVIDANSQMKPNPNRAKHFPKSTPQPPFYRACPKSHGLPPPRLLVNPQDPTAVRFRHAQTRPLNFPKYWQIQIPLFIKPFYARSLKWQLRHFCVVNVLKICK